jgi:hypothetical protein
MKYINKIFIVFLIAVFVLGWYLYAVGKLDDMFFMSKEGMETEDANGKPNIESCPDLLIRRGNVLLLYNSKMEIVDGVNPLPFYNLDEYINYLEIERKKGRNCPVLFLQHETTTQGEDVYRMRANPFQMDAGLMPLSAALPSQIPVPVIDSNRDHPPYNAGNYAGFDPTGLTIGMYTKLDEIHDSTSKSPDGQSASDNPMDSNWGGVLYTQGKIESGKYDENNITKPQYSNVKNTVFIPGQFGHPPPPNQLPPPEKE